MQRRWIERITAASLALVVLCGAHAAAQRYHTLLYTDVDGLPSAVVYDLDQAPDGVMWFATRTGLASFDGAHWSTFPSRWGRDTVSSRQIEIDGAGRIWVAFSFLDAGLGVLESGRWREVRPPPSESRCETRALALVTWAGTTYAAVATRHGLHLCDGSTWRRLDVSDGLPSSDVTTLAADGSELWVGTSAGVAVVRDGRVADVLSADQTPPAPIVGLEVAGGTERAVWMLGRGVLGVLGDRRFVECVASDALAFPDDRAVMAPDGRGGMYIGAPSSLVHYDAAAGRLEPLDHGFGGSGAHALMRDRDENLWFATFRGAGRLPSPRFLSWGRSEGLLDDEVVAIAETAPGHLVFSHPHGFSFLHGRRVETIDCRDVPAPTRWPSRISDLAVDRDGRIWAAGGGEGLITVEPDRSRFERHRVGDGAYVSSVLVDGHGRVWVGTHEGLFELSAGRFDLRLSVKGLRRVFEDGEGGFHLATDHGLVTYRNGVATKRLGGGPLADSVYAVLRANDGRTLVGTGAGLYVLGPDRLEPCRGGPEVGDATYFVHRDRKARLWLGTDKGVVVWDGKEQRHFQTRDGLAGQETNRAAFCEDSLGRIWIGTATGVSCYREAHDTTEPVPPTVELLAVESASGRLAPDRNHELGPDRGDVVFRFRAVSFRGRGDVRYRCRLEGFDGGWLTDEEIQRGSVRYTNLPPGRYRLEVQAAADDGPWGASARSGSFVVAPPLSQRAWFRAMMIGALVLLGYAAATYVSARRDSARLERLVRQRSAALERSEQRYREMFEKNRAAQLLLDERGEQVTDANPTACRLFGRSVEELRGERLSELTDGTPHDAMEADRQFVAAYRRPDGDLRHFQIYACALELEGRRIVQATLHDVTEHLRLEEEVQRSRRLNAIGQLAGGVAHDFNNLLMAIIGYTDLVADDVDDESPAAPRVAAIRKAASRGAALVKQLMVIGRKQVMQPETFCLHQAVSEVTGILRRLLGEHIEIVTVADPEPVYVSADRSQLDQVLINLAVNARDAMPDGGTLTISTAASATSAGGSRAVLTVEDTGRGIASEILPRIFDPFFTTKEVGQGTGLGLSMVYGVIEQSGGSIDVDSAPGRGTTFRIELPGVGAPAAPEPPAEESPAPVVRRNTVLVVEDDKAVREMIATALGRLGYRVITAADGVDALRFFEHETPRIDLVLTDIVMPRLGGRELAEEVASRRPDVKVLFMTGYAGAGHPDPSAPMLRKPFAWRELADAVAKMLVREEVAGGEA